ncbi:MAG: hypothetical protein P1V81_03295 [Planctomycetota bacterium]|nr:hypothetical protein [Planctomycetota bacterium]
MSPYDPQEFIPTPPPAETEGGSYEITIQVHGAAKVNRLLSWIVRSRAYDDVESLAVALRTEELAEESESRAG